MKTLLTIDQAMTVAVSEVYNESEWIAAERTFKAHRLCPHCACDGRRVKLGRLQDSTEDTYAGRECPECEEFIVDLGQDHHFDGSRPDPYEMAHSDADPGL